MESYVGYIFAIRRKFSKVLRILQHEGRGIHSLLAIVVTLESILGSKESGREKGKHREDCLV